MTTLDNVHHCCGILGFRKESNTGVHSSNNAMVPGSILKVNTSAGFREEGCHAVTTKDVPALRGGGLEIAEFVW